jgi:transglutaminase-like putative cysteine protease
VLRRLRTELKKLPGEPPQLAELLALLPAEGAGLTLQALRDADDARIESELLTVSLRLGAAALQLAEEIGLRYSRWRKATTTRSEHGTRSRPRNALHLWSPGFAGAPPAHLQPLDDDHQQLLSHDLLTEPDGEIHHAGVDSFGNACLWFSRTLPHDQLLVRSSSRVRLQPRFAALQPAASPPWDTLAAGLRYVARGAFDAAVQFSMPSPFVPRLEVLRAYAAASFVPGRPVLLGAIDLMQRIHADFEYRSASTQIDTPLAQTFEQRAGVCQDFAHMLAGALRMLGLPARYVSGYLLTQPAGAPGALLGADASHAWVQVYAPGTPGLPGDWLDLDPTNNLIVSLIGSGALPAILAT